jgi:hypothetical protein
MNQKKKVWQSNSTPQAPTPKAPLRATRAELELVLKKTQALALKNPEKAAIILSTWLSAKSLKKAA